MSISELSTNHKPFSTIQESPGPKPPIRVVHEVTLVQTEFSFVDADDQVVDRRKMESKIDRINTPDQFYRYYVSLLEIKSRLQQQVNDANCTKSDHGDSGGG
jgi:hypothetical protein